MIILIVTICFQSKSTTLLVVESFMKIWLFEFNIYTTTNIESDWNWLKFSIWEVNRSGKIAIFPQMLGKFRHPKKSGKLNLIKNIKLLIKHKNLLFKLCYVLKRYQMAQIFAKCFVHLFHGFSGSGKFVVQFHWKLDHSLKKPKRSFAFHIMFWKNKLFQCIDEDNTVFI